MANWDKLNKELDSTLDSMTPEKWTKWKNKNTITVCTGIGLNMFFPEYITIHMEEEYDPSISKPPTSAKEMFLAHPIPDVDNITPIVKLTSEQLKDLGLKNN